MSQQHLSQALRRIAASGTTAMTDRATALREAGRDVISLSVGEPDFPTPPHVIEAAKQALDTGATRYTPVTGTLRLKQAAALHFRRDLGIDCRPEDVIVTAGGKQAIFEALAATVSDGDEVIVPSPWWVSYPQMVRFAGGKVVPLITHPHHGFRFDPGDLEALITPRTNWLILNSPGNPTGAVFPRELLRGIGEVLRRHPRCSAAAYVSGPHTCTVRVAGHGVFTLTAAPEADADPAAYASSLYAWLSNGGRVGRRGVTLRTHTGAGVHPVTVARLPDGLAAQP